MDLNLRHKIKLIPLKYLIPVFYSIAIILMIIYQWTEQTRIRSGSGSPIYHNLMGNSAFIRHGFDPADIFSVPAEASLAPDDALYYKTQFHAQWVKFNSAPFTVTNSNLPDLQKRAFLSPFGKPAQEFTIIIPIEMSVDAVKFIQDNPAEVPGFFFSCIGENWEIYFNGCLVRSEMHLDENGRITEKRTWRDVYFPVSKELFIPGTNILALRIAGDPAYDGTGLFYSEPYYIDNYEVILKQHQNYLRFFLCGVLVYTGIYYLLIFLSVRKKEEIFNLYYGIFSLMLCVHCIFTEGTINIIIPDSRVAIRIEYLATFLTISMLCLFIEQMGRQKVTKMNTGFFIFSLFAGVTQIFFCEQYGDEIMHIFNISMLVYFFFVFFGIFRHHNKERRLNKIQNDIIGRTSNTFASLLIGSLLVYACGIFDALDIVFFRSSVRLFIYSTFVFHVGTAFTLSSRFSGLYKILEQSNVILEKTVRDRTLELENQTRIAIQASEAKTEFLATMSHEIRTPLNAVIGLSEIELQGELPEKTRNSINQIYLSGASLLGIINDILDISKIEAGGFELLALEYETASFINDTINLNRVRIGSKPINFILEINSDFPLKLLGDEIRVKQILNNILSNAIKYTNEGSVTLSVSWEKVHPINLSSLEAALLRFTVKDTGVGIRKDDLDKLFSDYSQLNTKANRRIEGTGLGLVITKKLLDMMGGKIYVESDYGRGSVFTAVLMQGIVSDETIGEETAKNLRNFVFKSNSHGNEIEHSWMPDVKVLIVDDLPVNLQVAQGLLKPYGLTADTVTSGQEAINKIFAGKTYDIIFMDHMMPGMDGIEAAAIIRKHDADVPVIALTANALVGMKEMFINSGFSDFLSKPIDIFKLNDILERWIPDEKKHIKINNNISGGNNAVSENVQNLSDSSAANNEPGLIIPEIPGVDTEKGVAATGGTMDGYLLVLSVFCVDAQNRISTFDKVLADDSDEKDISLFVINVHALKSALKTLVAAELSAKAAALEAAGKAVDMVFIRENLPEFIKNMTDLIMNIKNSLDSLNKNS